MRLKISQDRYTNEIHGFHNGCKAALPAEHTECHIPPSYIGKQSIRRSPRYPSHSFRIKLAHLSNTTSETARGPKNNTGISRVPAVSVRPCGVTRSTLVPDASPTAEECTVGAPTYYYTWYLVPASKPTRMPHSRRAEPSRAERPYKSD